jgi:hypothetical protein
MRGHLGRSRPVVLVGLVAVLSLAGIGAASARNAPGDDPSQPSLAIEGPVKNRRPPQNTTPPVITGQAQVGQSLSSSSGSWSGTQPMTFSYQWQRCDGSGASCTNLSGATASSYTTVSTDQGATLRTLVTATNNAGQASAQSAAFGSIAAAGGGGGGGGGGTQKLYWGAWIGSQFTGTDAPWDMNAVADFEKLTGKPLSLINFSSPWQNCYSTCKNYNFDTTAFDNVRNHGSIPFFSWGSDSLPVSLNEPNLNLGTIIAGNWDSYITTWATSAKNWGHPFFLRFNWEMNGNWFPWSEGVNGNTSGQFVKAWRHVHDIFTSVGATNATWVWCPNVDPSGSFTPLSTLYPGDSYVDWTCLNGYNRNVPWQSFDEIFGSTYDLVHALAPSKPMIVGEIASTEVGGSKPKWIADLLRELPSRYPAIRGFLWFEKYAGNAYPIETSRGSRSAFRRGIASPVYVANLYESLRGGTIRPPGP